MGEGFRAYGEGGELPIVLTRHQKEDHYQGSDVHPSVESKSTDRTESTQHSRESQGKDGGPKQTGRDSPRPIRNVQIANIVQICLETYIPISL